MIKIGAYFFDDYSGDIRYPRKRVVSYARTDKAGVGIQILPNTAETFQLQTIRFEDPTNLVTFLGQLDALIGTDVAIITESITYQTDANAIFSVEDVVHGQEEQLIRARGVRDGVVVDHSPAALVRSTWTLRSGPFS